MAQRRPTAAPAASVAVTLAPAVTSGQLERYAGCVVDLAAATPRLGAPLSLPFALLGLVLAQVTMAAVGANEYDHPTYVWGLGFCALLGAWLGSVQVTPSTRRWLTLAAGLLAGSCLMSLAALRSMLRYWDEGLTSNIAGLLMIGAATGAVPALVLAGVDYASAARGLPSADVRERTMTPFVITCALVSALAVGPLVARQDDAQIAVVMALLSLLSLTEIALRDRSHSRFLARVFAGTEAGHEIVDLAAPRNDVPLAVGGVQPGALLVRTNTGVDYRSAATRPIFQTALVLPLAIEPLHKRGRLIVLTQAVTVVVMLSSAFVFAPAAPRSTRPRAHTLM